MGEFDVINCILETIKKCLRASSGQQSGTVGSGCEPIFFSLLLILESIQISSAIAGCRAPSAWTLPREDACAGLTDGPAAGRRGRKGDAQPVAGCAAAALLGWVGGERVAAPGLGPAGVSPALCCLPGQLRLAPLPDPCLWPRSSPPPPTIPAAPRKVDSREEGSRLKFAGLSDFPQPFVWRRRSQPALGFLVFPASNLHLRKS